MPWIEDSCVSLQYDVSVLSDASDPVADKLPPLFLISELFTVLVWMGLKSMLEGTKFNAIAPNNIRAPK